ncbi:MAG: hypothetical protein OEU32_05050 [Acidimicrobiia bacterium]|nr:hypothetical protein [Acidimicrobiia bacterium]
MTEASIEFSEILGRRVRLGSWEDQKISTYRKIADAVSDGSWDHAADLADYFTDEANVCFSLYRQWINQLQGFLRDNGATTDEVDAIDAAIVAKLDLPDGTPWNARRHWDRYRQEQRALLGHIYRQETDAALTMLAQMKETWRQTHDRDVDHTYGLMSAAQERHGAQGIADMFQVVLVPLFSWRYNKFDIDQHPWEEGLETLMMVACEAMRGHLVGPERTGDFDLVETDDRFVLRFDPCGSGQRTIRGDWIEGTPARMEPPYNWGVSEEEASWNHYTKGVCLYCAHCIVLMEELPIDRFGYPVRVIDPPIYPDTDRDPEVRQQCQWTMFKDPTAVPEEVYVRVGRTKPSVFGSSHFDAPELPDAGALGLPGTG